MRSIVLFLAFAVVATTSATAEGWRFADRAGRIQLLDSGRWVVSLVDRSENPFCEAATWSDLDGLSFGVHGVPSGAYFVVLEDARMDWDGLETEVQIHADHRRGWLVRARGYGSALGTESVSEAMLNDLAAGRYVRIYDPHPSSWDDWSFEFDLKGSAVALDSLRECVRHLAAGA